MDFGTVEVIGAISPEGTKLRKIKDYIWAIRLAAKLEWRIREFSPAEKQACLAEFYRRAYQLIDDATKKSEGITS